VDGYTTRSRSLPFNTGREYYLDRYVGKHSNDPDDTRYPFDDPGVTVNGTQVTVSRGNPWRSRKGPSSGDIGGDFSTEKTLIHVPEMGSPIKYTSPLEDYSFHYWHQTEFQISTLCPVDPRTVNSSFTHYKSSNDALDELGATAVSRCKPTNSVADLSTFLGETLRDGLPHLLGASTWQARTKLAKDAGDDFLNYQFGWLPLVSDVRKFAEGVRHMNTVISQYERDAGRQVRRNYHFPDQKSESSELFLSNRKPWYGVGVTTAMDQRLPLGDVYRTVETERSTWFSGAFTYHLPSGYDSRNKMDKLSLIAKQVFGAKLTPETLWNLTPWSWAVDWFSNTGDVLSNVSSWATDGLVMQYGYIMEESITRHTYRFVPTKNWDGSSPYTGDYKAIPPLIVEKTSKIRRRANPFGFGVTWEGLSPIQAAIAAALGLSRS